MQGIYHWLSLIIRQCLLPAGMAEERSVMEGGEKAKGHDIFLCEFLKNVKFWPNNSQLQSKIFFQVFSFVYLYSDTHRQNSGRGSACGASSLA